MKILVPIDGSQNSLKAVEHAAMLAEKLDDVTVTLSYVIMYEQYVMASPALIETVGITKANEALAVAEEELKKYNTSIVVDKIVERGSSAADKIIELAEAGKYDMIVMGSRGLSNLKRFLMGSVSTRVSQHSPCTVVLVR